MMRSLPAALVLCCLLAAPLAAQTGSARPPMYPRGGSPVHPLDSEPSYKQITIHLAEYSGSLSEEQFAELRAADDLTPLLAKLKKAESIKLEKSYSLWSMEHVNTSAQYGGVVTLVESAEGGRGARNRQANVGTTINVQWTTHEEKIVVTLNYEKSESEPMPEDSPTIGIISLSTTIGIEPGHTLSAGGIMADGVMRFLTISVTRRD